MARYLTLLPFVIAQVAIALAAEEPVWKVRPLAQEGVVVAKSPDPASIFLGSPSILRLANGELVASHDHFGAGVSKLEGPIGLRPHFSGSGNKLQAVVYTSSDRGVSWSRRASFPFTHARLFADGDSLYLMGNCGRIMITRSTDAGRTWSGLSALTDNDTWAMGAANVHEARGHVYAPMMLWTDLRYRGYFISTLAPVMFRAKQGADLLDPKAWTQSQPQKPFRDWVDEEKLDYFGVPFFSVPDRNSQALIREEPRLSANRIGWHEPYVVEITDPTHEFYDPERRTLHILARGDVHRPNFGMLSKVVEKADGSMEFGLQKTPAGTHLVFLPMPGGNIKFHILQDPETGLYWLLSNQVTDSMIKPEKMPSSRFGLPLDQRERLVLHYSRNLTDWVFAGLVAKGSTFRESFHYCSMAIDGDDLVILSRTGGPEIRQTKAPFKDAHDTNLITFHRVRSFRGLEY